MTTAREQWQQVKRILADVLEREPDERPAYLDEVCTEPAVRREVESLIAAGAQREGLVSLPAAEGGGGDGALQLGSYEIIEPLAAGGMGVVYKARDTKLARSVALKILPTTVASDPHALTRFRREAKILASLTHPNIVTIYEIGQEGDTVFIVMELVDGKVLSERLSAGPMRIEEVADIAAQIATGLAFAHQARVVHRDLKPRNIMIRHDGIVKILDFGLGKLAPEVSPSLRELSTELTGPQAILGTVDYMSPQQAAGLPVDFRSDQFSFGAVLYEMVTGKRPFERGTPVQTLSAIIEDEPAPAKSWNPQLTPALDAVIRRCLKKDPAERYASTDELARELREGQEQFRSRRPAGLRRWAWVALIAFLCLLAVGGVATIAPQILGRLHTFRPLVHRVAVQHLAVLPFTNIGEDPASQAFCDGVAEILSSKLSQLQQFQKTLRVVPATDVLEEGIVSVREARKAFGVNLVITGSVQQAQESVRMTINLVDPQQLRLLKSKTIDTDVHDVSTMQDGVVLAAAQLLNVKLTTQAQQVLTIGGTSVPDAYQYYAQGRGYLQRYEAVQNLDSAASLFKRALEKDPHYALAEAGLGEAYWRKYDLTKNPRWAEEAQKSSEVALRLNNKLAEVYVTLGMIQSGTGHYHRAIENLQKALAIDPLNPDVYRGLAKAYQGMGRIHDAESTYLRAIAVRPSYWGFHNDLGGLYFRLGRYPEAEKQFRSIVQLTPDNTRGYNNLGAVAFAQKRYQEAAKMFERSTAIQPSDSALSNLGTIYYTLGQYAVAARYYQQAIQLNGDDSEYWHNLAAAYEWSDQADKARAAFRETARLAEKELRINPNDARVLLLLADSYSMLDKPHRAQRLLVRGLARAPHDVFNLFQAAVVYEQLGDRRLALKCLAEAVQGGFSRDVIEREPSLAALRRDPAYRNLFGPK